jgi:hypothetical protein
MLTATANSENATIQIRLPFDTQQEINKKAKKIGISISEYASKLLLLQFSRSFNRDVEKFWEECEEIESEYRAGNYQTTSAKELIEIARQARNEN